MLRHELGAAFANGSQGRLGQHIGLHPPLVGQEGLDDDKFGLLVMWHHDLLVFDVVETARRVLLGQGRQVRDNGLAGFETVHAAIFRRDEVGIDDGAARCENIDRLDTGAGADLEVVEVMRRGDLHCPGAQGWICVFVGDDRNAAPHQWQLDELANQALIALVLRMHGHGDVAQHGFRAGRCNYDVVAGLHARDIALFVRHRALVSHAIGQRVAQMPHMALDLDILNFEVRNRGLKARMPVHQPLGAVNEATLVQLDEHLGDGANHLVVGLATIAHREFLAAEIGRSTKALQLIHDRAAALCFPLPDAIDKGVAAHGAAVELFLGKLALDDHLGGDAGMIGAWLPENILLEHAIEADKNVLDGVVERVPDM